MLPKLKPVLSRGNHLLGSYLAEPLIVSTVFYSYINLQFQILGLFSNKTKNRFTDPRGADIVQLPVLIGICIHICF